MNYQELEEKVIQWADDKGILSKATQIAQATKTAEEVQELLEACFAQSNDLSEYYNSKGKLVNTQDELEDALGDILVTIIIGAKLQGVSLESCLEKAYNVIAKRTGKMVNGVFIKDK